jgi:hypothetical protein
MWGHFQKSQIKIEVAATGLAIQASLTYPVQLQEWLQPLRLSPGLPEQLGVGDIFTSQLPPVVIHHQVERLGQGYLRLILSQGIDGFHEWSWGEGWVQSRLEGVSLLPLEVSNKVSLWRLRYYLNHAAR